MPNIIPISSDFKNYSSALNIEGINKQEKYEKNKAALRLMYELENGRKSGEENRWISSEDVRAHFYKK